MVFLFSLMRQRMLKTDVHHGGHSHIWRRWNAFNVTSQLQLVTLSVGVTHVSCGWVLLTNLHLLFYHGLLVVFCIELNYKELCVCRSGLKTVLLTLSAIGHARTSFCKTIATSSSFALKVLCL